MTSTVRTVTDHDWPAIVALEAEAYGSHGLSESPAALASRAADATSFVLDVGGGVAGYLLALPYPRFRCPDLSRAEETVFASANLHLHDMVIADAVRRTGLGGRLLRTLVTAARREAYQMISLVSVADSRKFWHSRGFRPHFEVALPSVYGPDAIYMSRPLQAES
ncbi:GNAT family N-acetyltransferase [Micromonosporaceae bacterium Da 78-11]